MESNIRNLEYQRKQQEEKVTDNVEKIKLNKTLPYLVSNVVEILELPDDDSADSKQGETKSSASTSTSVVVKTTTRQTVFLPLPGLVDPSELKPGELVGC